ncbi:MAG: argininosuccinate lyase [Phycisphaerales bacterium]|nr:argininosuccinate lyase [Phycisphaerales bacterium]
MSRGLAQGRFDAEADPLFRQLNDSLPFDHRLLVQDIEGSIAWAAAIAAAGVLSPDELAKLTAALNSLLAEARTNPDLVLQSLGRDEDVHSYVERRLIESVGALGKKLHTGRSRNDQVATDVRLWTRSAIDARLSELRDARRSLVNLAARERSTIFPGYTHLQRAQPILFAHWALAYESMLARDSARLTDCRERVNICPLGSAALAGTTYAIDRVKLARDLGFSEPSANSLDATADRDFIAETLFCLAQTSVHLSRMAEDLILFMTQEYGFVEMDDSVTSGSSLMPQKKNPDACELLRGKSGRLIGSLVSILATMKGLPLAYNKDLQEDKEPLFDAMDQLSMCLRVVPRVLDGLKVRREVCRDAALGGYANATELADYLVGKGVPFREAHDIVGRLVRHAISKFVKLEELTLVDFTEQCKAIGPDVYDALKLDTGLARREVLGGTGPKAVAQAIERARRALGHSPE